MLRWLTGVSLCCVLFLAACSASGGTTAGGAVPTATTPASPTTTAGGTTTPAATTVATQPSTTPEPATLKLGSISVSAANSACSNFAQPSDTLEQIGDFALDITGKTPVDYPGTLLPANLPTTAPYAISLTDLNHDPIANPSLGFGYEVRLCNLSSTSSATLQGIGMRIASQSLSGSGQADVAEGNSGCAEFFQLPNTITGGGCGGSYGPHQGFTATWPGTVSVGTSVVTAQTSVDDGSIEGADSRGAYGALPITIKPGYVLDAVIGMNTYPTPDGTYTFAIGVQFSGFAKTYSGIQTPPALMLSHAVKWDGENCQGATALIAQMKAGQTYMCPRTS